MSAPNRNVGDWIIWGTDGQTGAELWAKVNLVREPGDLQVTIITRRNSLSRIDVTWADDHWKDNTKGCFGYYVRGATASLGKELREGPTWDWRDGAMVYKHQSAAEELALWVAKKQRQNPGAPSA